MSKSTKWFLLILGILALVAIGFSVLVISLTSYSGLRTITSGAGDKIGLVEIKGAILSSEDFVRQIKSYGEDRSIRAVLLRLDSPGGGVVASQEIYEEVRRTRDGGKPVVVSMGSVAASGAYYIACGSSRIVANRGTLTGSIGVISEFMQLHEALGKLGIEVKAIKSGRLKDAGSPTRNMTELDRKYFQGLIDEVHQQFVRVVREERGLEPADVRALADGRVFTGEQAVSLGLVDTLGTFQESIQITAALAGIKGEPAIVKERRRTTWMDNLFGEATGTLAALAREVLDRPILSYRYAGP